MLFRTEFGSSLCVTVHGNIDTQSAKMLAGDLALAVKMPWGECEKTSGQATLVVDLSNVEFINSMGIGALLRCKQVAEEHGKEVLLLINPALADVFEIANLHSVFRIVTPYRSITGQNLEEE